MAQDLKANVEDLNNMILQGQILEAFDKYYAPDVKMQDNDYPVREGFDANREHEVAFTQSLTEFRGAKVLNTIISDDVVAVEWWFDYTHKDYGVRAYKQLAVQRWRNGKIVEEKFYYNN